MSSIGIREDLELFDTIILNGKIEYCNTYDDNEKTIGIKTYKQQKCLDGSIHEEAISEFAFTKEMEDRCRWVGKYANIQMLTGDKPIDLEHVDETKVVSMIGEVESEYHHYYSDYTGYLYTKEGFICGGHNIPEILTSHNGEYIHMEIKLYREK